QRVRATDPITTHVPLHFLNGDEAPAVKLHQQVITHVTTELEITCLPADLPTSIQVELGEVDASGNVYLQDIELPDGVTYAGAEETPVLAAALTRRGAGADEDETEDDQVEGDSDDAEGTQE